MRCVAEAPLKTLKADLGLHDPGRALTSTAVQSKEVGKQLQNAMARLEEQGRQLEALIASKPDNKAVCCAQNMRFDVRDVLRAGDASHMACGWSVGAVEQRKRGFLFLSDIRNIRWSDMCDRCMIPERQAARLLLPAAEMGSDLE